MALPINVLDLIHARKVENERIEYKTGFNPLEVMQAICAFANDVNNWGGGYIILGVNANDGVPVFPLEGIEKSEQDGIYNKILQYCNLIEPNYFPIIDTETIDGKDVIVLWVTGGDLRPYKCPISYGKNSDKAYYVRKASSTVKATAVDERNLFALSNKIPFDDRPNQNADIESDFSMQLIRGYLKSIDSDLYKQSQSLTLKQVADRMRITGGYKENPKPLNVGLMFFNDDPERFFRYARIEVVDKPNPTGQGMTEKIFTGPLDRQLRDALQYIKNYVLKEKIFKVENQAEALRVYNYPYTCVEEILVNAVYHKGYDIHEPIVVTVTPDKMQIKNCPGPDASITDEQIKNYNMVADRYRNRRIGDFLKELEFVEGRNTGIPTALESLKNNGSEPLSLETNADRTYFTVTIPVNSAFLTEGAGNGSKKTRRSKAEIRSAVITELKSGSKSTAELVEVLGYTKLSATMAEVLKELMSESKISYTDPDHPSNPYQKYKLVKK
jgi:ATP-dependent DNA helicase RecG